MKYRLAYLTILLFSSFVIFSQEKRIALVIGNANYSNEAILKNPINDALLMQSTLQKLGFDVMIETDIETHGEFVDVIEKYNEARKKYNIGMIYYAGHAVQINGENYMLATKEKYESESNIKYKGLDIKIFSSEWNHVYQNEINVLILDACRNNPFEKKIYGQTRDIKTTGLGLAEIKTESLPAGSLVAFSTAAGYTASDAFEESQNSLYCQSLAKNLLLEDVSIRNVFGKVSKEVYKQTGQYPELSDKMFDVDFYLIKSTFQDQILEIDSLIENDNFDLANEKTLIILGKSPNEKAALLRKGRIEYITKNSDYNGSHLLKADSLYPKDIEVIEYLSRYYSTIGDFVKAKDFIDKAINLDEQQPKLYYWKARIYEDGGFINEAEKQFEKYVLLDSTNESLLEEADFFERNNNIEQAINDVTKAIVTNPKDPKLFTKRAELFVKKQNFHEALRDYDQLIKLSPNEAFGYMERADFYLDRLDFKLNRAIDNIYIQQALDDYEIGLKLSQNDKEKIHILNNRSIIYRNKGLFELAINELSTAILMKPNESLLYQNRAENFAKNGNLERAFEDYTNAIKISNFNADRIFQRYLFQLNYRSDIYGALSDINESIRIDSLEIIYFDQRARLWLYYFNDTTRALNDWKQILLFSPNNIDAMNAIGFIYVSLGDTENAFHYLNKAINDAEENSSSVSFCLRNRANLFLLLGDLDSAEFDFSKAIELSPKEANFYFDRFLFYINNKKDFKSGIKDIDNAIKIDPQNIDYLYARGSVYSDYLSNYSKAISDFEQILSIDSADIDAINAIGTIYEQQGKLDLALAQYEIGIKLEKSNPAGAAFCFSNRAAIYSEQGKLEEALRDYSKAIGLNPTEPAYYSYRGNFYKDVVKNPYDALVDYSLAISLDSSESNYWWHRGKLFSEHLNNQTLAIKDFEQILKIKPNDINAMNWLTIFYDRNNNTENAINGYKKIISFGDSIKKLEYKLEDYGWANINLAEIYQCDRKIDEALALYNEGINYMPEYVKAYYWRSWFFALYMSRYDEAINDFATSIKLEPKNPHWYLNRSKIYQMKGDIKKATNDIDEAVKISNESAIYLAERGNFYSSINQHQKALTDFKKSANLDSTSRRLYHYITEDLIRQGKIEDAIKNAAKTNKIFKNDTVSFEQLGRIYMAKNDLLKSLDSYTQAVSIMEFNEGDRTIYPHDIQVFLSDVYLNIAVIYSKLNQSDLECDTLQKAEEIIINETRPDRQKMIAEIQERLKKCQN